MSIKDFRTRNEIIIKTRGQARVSLSGDKPKKGLIESKQETRYLPRRLSQSKLKGINFFDLSIKNLTNQRTSFVGEVNNSGFTAISAVDITTGQQTIYVSDIESKIFDIPLVDFKDAFSRITKPSVFEKAVSVSYGSEAGTLDSLPDWTDEGLIITPPEVDGMVISPDVALFSKFSYTIGGTNPTYKVTGSNDVNATAISFNPSENFNVYFLPAVLFVNGKTDFSNDLSVTVVIFEALNWFWTTYPRQSYQDYLDAVALVDTYEKTYALWDVLRSFSNARAWSGQSQSPPTPPFPSITPELFPKSLVYQPTSFNVFPALPFNRSHSVKFDNQSWSRLEMIFEDGGAFYYVFNIDGSNDPSGGGGGGGGGFPPPT